MLYFNQSIGISWYTPLGRTRLIEIGSALESNSTVASEIESLISCGTLINAGAPKESCKDLAPVILAFSNRVMRAGPIKTCVPLGVISLSSNSISG